MSVVSVDMRLEMCCVCTFFFFFEVCMYVCVYVTGLAHEREMREKSFALHACHMG